MKTFCAVISATLLASTLYADQASPTVKMSVTLPDGQTQQLSASESGLATVTLKDGTEIGVRPTILDSKPWSRVIITFFKMPTTTHSTELMGEVEVKTGGGAVTAKTNPALKVSVTAVSDTVATTH